MHERVAVFRRAALITKHMGYDAESVELKRGAQRGELGRVTSIPALGVCGSTIEQRKLRHHVVYIGCHRLGIFLNLAFLAPGKFVEYGPEVPPDLPKQHLLAVLGVNTTWYLHSHVAWFRWL